MKLNKVYKISAIIFMVSFVLMSWQGVDFGMNTGLASSESEQPNNSFNSFSFDGISEQENEMYGWNMTYINSLNDDPYFDLVIGAPWFDKNNDLNVGAVYIFYGKVDSGFDNLNHSAADVIITGDYDADKFGWDVADAGDVNNDGINDLIVGAVGNNNNPGKAYVFLGGTLPNGNYAASELAHMVLRSDSLGIPFDGYYGSSVSGVGDLNNDGYDDVVVGAPGVDKAVISYGYKDKVTIYPSIWDDDTTSKGVVTFDKGVSNTNNDLNTWGLDGDDDGWDWIDSFSDPSNLYGQTSPAPHDNANLYAPFELDGPDADGLTWKNKTALEVMIGRNHTDLSPYGDGWDWDPGTSAAWGIEFNIDQELYDYISKNSSIEISFDYEATDSTRIYNNSNLSRNFIYTMLTRIWNSNGIEYLGDISVNDKNYFFYHQDNWNVPAWGPIYGSFEWDITDLIIAPGSYYWDFGCYFERRWSSRYDDGIMAFFDNISMRVSNEKHTIIQGVENSGFGTAIAPLGDVNEDGNPDMLIGAPNIDSGLAALIQGKERFSTTESIGLAKVILTGNEPGDKFGYSLASAGDVDNDGLQDVIIGAPGGNYAQLYYGNTLKTGVLVPDLWEKNEEMDTPQIEFDSGLKSTGNTPGLSAPNDGWDTWNGVYGYESGATAGSSVKFNGADGTDSDQVAADDELIIAIGGGLGGGSTTGATPDSGAYGVKFTISSEMAAAIKAGGKAVLSYDWYFENIGLDQDDTIWIKTSIRNQTDVLDLGWDLDNYAAVNDNKDDTKEVHWAELPDDMRSAFIQRCSECFSDAGSYYLDIGAKVRNYWWDTTWEDGVFHFDNVYLRINPAPDVEFIGPANSGFGFSVGSSKKLNVDEYDDIIIGAPYYDSPNGIDSGAVFGFLMGPNSEKVRLADTAEFVSYGENAGDNFGWTLLGAHSLDADEFTEILTSAINFDSPSINAGKIYLLSISKGPRIWLLPMAGDQMLSGKVVVNATVTDPDNNIDTALGVYFYYSTDLNTQDWTLIGNDDTPSNDNGIYEVIWDTTLLPDGNNYYVKSWVQDLLLNKGENFSQPLTIDNSHKPHITIKNPTSEATVNGIVEIDAVASDSELDIIGGGINNTKGVLFFISKDHVNWTLVGTDNIEEKGVYSVTFDTSPIQDGEYWLKVNTMDLDGYEVEEEIKVVIDNPNRKPEVVLLSPLNVTELSGKITVSASAFDYDGDINNSGVTFYISSDTDTETWQEIGNMPTPVVNTVGTDVYSITWNTATVADDWYHLKAVVTDSVGLNNESNSSEFCVHNHENNPPVIDLISPTNSQIVDVTQVITVRVRDLENNIGPNGVFYYYSSNKVDWHYLGNTAEPRANENEYYDFIWATDAVPDGEYWLNVTVSDETGLIGRDHTEDYIIVHNSNLNNPIVEILNPSAGQHIKGTYKVSAAAFDLENNIDKNGVAFYYSWNNEDWNIISNIKQPTNADRIYELAWDTSAYEDGKYWLRAEVSDIDGLTDQDTSDYFYIHNNMNNPPTISLYNLANNEVNGTIKINATVFDLDNDISADGVEFYISTDKETWTLLGNDPIGAPSNTNDQNIYEITWDTTYVPDNMYWLKVSVQDLTNNINSDVSQEYIIVHNNRDNPPIIKFKEPRMNLPLGQIEPIVVEVIDFENDVDGVSFYYSKDNRTWEIIDTRDKPEKNDLYRIIWSTSEINNGWYYIKVKARDSSGHSSEVTTGPFEVTEGKEPGSQSKDASGFLGLIISVITIIIIILLLIVMLIRRSKKREKKLIEEVASELRHTMELETEGEQEGIDNDNDLVGYPSETPDNTAVQTYIPSTNVSAQVPQINNVEPNPQLPPPSANVNVNATGTVNMAQPVQGTEDMPMTSEPIPVHMPETPEAPPEMELPPEIDLPPLDEPEIPISPYVAGCTQEPTEASEMPQSPFAQVQTQSLEDELEGKADIVELPEE